jgi:hypothetical protein
MNSNNRIAATLYSLGTVCLRNISVNTLHKGDDDDDDNNNNNNNNKLLFHCVKECKLSLPLPLPLPQRNQNILKCPVLVFKK